jgi:mannose-6-phosphate isomerase-like protein (cupin superfamily)
MTNILLLIAAILAAYLLIGYLLHLVIFPEKKPDVSAYFKPGDVFYSKVEGFRQTVVKQENGLVHCHVELDPHAPGPPEHIHTGFDEVVEIENGEVNMRCAGKETVIRPGESFLIKKGVPHKFWNSTGETIRVKGSMAFPEKFAFTLSQVYGYMDENPNFAQSKSMIFQITMMQQVGFDSYIAGPPVFMQKLIGFLSTPLSRLAGMKTYYERYHSPIKA